MSEPKPPEDTRQLNVGDMNIEEGDKLDFDGGEGVYQTVEFVVQEVKSNGVRVQPNDFKPYSFHLNTANQLQNAEAGDVYRVRDKNVVYGGKDAMEYFRLGGAPFYGLRTAYINIKDGKKVIVDITDGRDPIEKEEPNYYYMKDPHVDTFRRTGRNIFQTSRNIPDKVKKRADALRINPDEDTYAKIKKMLNGHLYLSKEDLQKYFYEKEPQKNPLLEAGKYHFGQYYTLKEQDQLHLPIDVSGDGKSRPPDSLRYFARLVRDLAYKWEIPEEAWKAPPSIKAKDHMMRLLEAVNDKASDLFEDIGSGAFREVYSLPNDMVLKVAKRPRSIHNNIGESDEMLQKEFPNLFPEVKYKTKSGIWIAMERVRVIHKDSQMLKRHFPNFYEAYEMVDVSSNHFLSFMFKQLEDFYWKAKSDKLANDDILKGRLRSFLKNTFLEAYDVPKEFPAKLWEGMKENDLYHKILMAGKNFGIDLYDIRGHNVGEDGEGNFVILDAGIA